MDEKVLFVFYQMKLEQFHERNKLDLSHISCNSSDLYVRVPTHLLCKKSNFFVTFQDEKMSFSNISLTAFLYFTSSIYLYIILTRAQNVEFIVESDKI